MATLDIRNDECEIDRIRWGYYDFVVNDTLNDVFIIIDSNNKSARVRPDEISDLIKALQRAKELWLDKT